LIPPGNLARSEPLVCAAGSPGLDLRLLNGEAVITSVKPGSPAWEAGLRPGFVIQAVDGIPVEQIVQEAELNMRPPYNYQGCIAIFTKAILGRIYGTPGTEVLITYSEDRGEQSDTLLIRTKRNGAAIGPNGILYLAIDFEAKRLENGIGYIRLNTFQQPLAPMITSTIKSMGNIPAIIFDLRGNAGGEIEEMPDLFLNDKSLLFLRKSRNGEIKMFFDPAEDAYDGPLVLLIDQLSGSACELFAACLQAAGRAVVIGEQSPGSVMESDMKIFPNGSILMYPVAQPVIPDGTVIEGRGVIPDIEVGLDREMLLKGVDSQIDAAIKYLNRVNKI
jgi:carboxyl-terminal processing protease